MKPLSIIIKKHFYIFGLYLFFGILGPIITVADLYLTNALINSVVKNNENWLFYLGLFIGINFLAFIFHWLKFRFTKLLSFRLISFISTMKTNQLTNSAYNKNFNSGVTKSELLNNAPSIINNFIIGFFSIINTFVLVILASIFLFTLHWILAVVAIVFSIGSTFIIKFFSALGSKYNVEIAQIDNLYNSDVKKIIKTRNELYLFQKINFFNTLILNLTISKNIKAYQKFKKLIAFHIPSLVIGFILQLLGPIISAILASQGLVALSVMTIASFTYGVVFMALMSLPTQIFEFVKDQALFKKFVMKGKKFVPKDHQIKAIELKNFSPLINGKELIKNKLNFLIKIGSKVRLIGKNGAGKSATLNAIKTNSDFSGKLIINPGIKSQLIDDQKIVFLNESPHIFNGTVKANITLFAKDYDVALVKKVANLANLKMDLDKHISISKISDGERQKIALARAIIAHPNFIFIDEGFNNISVADRKRISEILLQTKAAIVIISHKELGGDYEKIEIIK